MNAAFKLNLTLLFLATLLQSLLIQNGWYGQ